MEGVYLLQSNGTITSLLGCYSKSFEEEAFREFGDKTKQFGHLFDTNLNQICNRKAFSFDVSEGTRLSFVFSKDSPLISDNPTLSELFTVAFKSFTSKLILKTTSPVEGDVQETVNPQARAAQKSLNSGSASISATELFRSSELLLRLAIDYQNYVASQPDPIFPTAEWENMLATFKDDIRIAAVRSSCTLAAQLDKAQMELACVQQGLEASRALQRERCEEIDVLTRAVEKLALQVEKNEHNKTILSQQHNSSAHTIHTSIPIINKLPNVEEKCILSERKSTVCEVGDTKEVSGQREEVSTDSNPDKNVEVVPNVEELLLASKHTIFYLQRDLEAMKLERDSYYHQILELRRAREIYEEKRRHEMEEASPTQPPGFVKKKPKGKGAVAAPNGKTNTLNGQVGQMKDPILKTALKKGEK
jgi:hypothetical protein